MLLKSIKERVDVLDHTDERKAKQTIVVPTEDYNTSKAIIERHGWKIDKSEELDSGKTRIKYSPKGVNPEDLS